LLGGGVFSASARRVGNMSFLFGNGEKERCVKNPYSIFLFKDHGTYVFEEINK